MNFIDIASHQAGINLPVMFSENNLDGVIVKATQGTSYVNPYFGEWSAWLNGNQKPWGTYHYCIGEDAKAEAQFFYNAVKPFIGTVVPAADYEEQSAMQRGTVWLKEFLDEFYRISGVRCLVYCSQSVTQSQNFNAIAQAGYQLWMAQYADYNPVYGFLDNPWHKGSVSPFMGWVMHQYTSSGILNGWRSRLDLDKFYGNASDWKALAHADAPTPPAELKPADPAIVSEVLMGHYGIGGERIAKLTAAGYDADSVQNKINELYGIASKVKPIIGNNTDYINSIASIVRSI